MALTFLYDYMERKYKTGKEGEELDFIIHWEIQCRFLGHSGETLLKVGGRGEGKVK